jgi:hypothetical protein
MQWAQPGAGRRGGREGGQVGKSPGGHDLPRGVDVGGRQPVAVDGREHRAGIAAEHSGHPGRLGRRCRGHRRGTHRHQPHGVIGRQDAGDDPGREFPDAVTGGRVGDDLARAAGRLRAR